MASNRTGNVYLGKNYQPGLARRVGAGDSSNRSPPMVTDNSDVQFEMMEQLKEMNKLFEALIVIKRFKIADIERLLLKDATAMATNELYGQESEAKWAERRDWQIRYQELQGKFDKIQSEIIGMKEKYQMMVTGKTTIENENEKLRSMLKKTNQELSEQEDEKSRLQKIVESVDEGSKSLKAQLQEKEKQLQKQDQGRNWQMEYEKLENRHNDLQRKFDKTDGEINGIKDKYQMMVTAQTKIENENENLRSMLKTAEQEFSEQKSEISRLLKLNEKMDKESKSFKAELQEKEKQLQKQEQGRNWQVEYEKLENRHNDLQRKFDKTDGEINGIKDKYQMMVTAQTKIENENENLRSMLKTAEQEFSEQKSEISRLLKLNEKMDKESKSFKAELQEKEKQLQGEREKTKKAYAEKDDVLTRLSRHMGQQMSEGNPNITDLSDQNRPSKLGERYSELYDNEWTNAFEVLTDKIDLNVVDKDKSAIEVLRKILLVSYKSAFDLSLSQMVEAEYKLSGSSKGVGPECKRLLKEARKHIDIKQADSLLKNVLEGTIREVIDRTYLIETQVQVFAKECFQLCWLMAIQDPPVVLAEDPIKGGRFDTSMYKHYTNSGDATDYVVWPALLLHKGGPLLTKGVAQPVPKLRPKSASVLGEKKITGSGTFDKMSRSLYGNKLQDVTSAQRDASSWNKLEHNLIPTQTSSSQRNTAPKQRLAANATQFDPNLVLVNDEDVKLFERFCSLYPSNSEETLRHWFGGNFQRYYELYIFIKRGDHSYA